MNDDQLIQLLKANRPEAPSAPRSEWDAIAAAAASPFKSLWERLRLPALALSGALGVAVIVFFGLPPKDDTAALASFVSDAGLELSGVRVDDGMSFLDSAD